MEWSAVEEGFRLLERDLAKLQVNCAIHPVIPTNTVFQHFIDINATGFRKILKKWDKRSRSTTKELYLVRQIEVQPVFNRQVPSQSPPMAAVLIGSSLSQSFMIS